MKRKNTKKSFWKKKSGRALTDVGKWLLIYGVTTLIFSGVSLVYLEIYSIAAEVVPSFVGLTFLEFYLAAILIMGIYFTYRGVSILQKKVPIENVHLRTIISFILLVLAFIPLGWVIYLYKGANVIFGFYLALAIVNAITVISLIRYQIIRISER